MTNLSQTRDSTTVLVIGSGLAGAVAALLLAEAGVSVTLVNSGPEPDNGNSFMAQGGIVYRAEKDPPGALARDITIAGADHNYAHAVRHICAHGPAAVREILIDRLHIPFNRSAAQISQEWDLTLEGGHSSHRILHCADYTGRAIMTSLLEAIAKSPNINLLKGRTAVDLITSHHHAQSMEFRYQLPNRCAGAYVFNETVGQVETLLADFTVLATGGIGQVYLHTTNAPNAVGSGLTMAHRAGVRIENAEFVQFHPTAFYQRHAPRFLVTEAMRGEGARLINSRGEMFMSRYDPRADLAPRDIVARSISEEMLRLDDECVYLDAASHLKCSIAERFPTIYAHCMAAGLDVTQNPIPVVPAAHYFCGGILTDLNARTSLSTLYAVGECACTGVHGANRLASVSLLEAVLWGRCCAHDVIRRLRSKRNLAPKSLHTAIPDWESPGTDHNDDPTLISQDWSAIRHTMWNYVGITRSTARLQRAFEELRQLSRRITDFYSSTPLSRPLIQLMHGCHAAFIITEAARRNKTSLGCHYRID